MDESRGHGAGASQGMESGNGMTSVRLVGGFGSAGAGNRTGRRIALHGGISTNAKEAERRKLNAGGSGDVALSDPSADELNESIRVGRCWWCKKEKGRDGKVFKSLSQHWSKAHGINPQRVRDIVGAPKNRSFVSEDLRDQMADRGRRLYDPQKLRCKAGTKKYLSAYGVAANRKKFSDHRDRVGEDEFRRMSARTAKGSAEAIAWSAMAREAAIRKLGNESVVRTLKEAGAKAAVLRRKHRKCVVCGAMFWMKNMAKGTNHRRTCSDECLAVRKSQNATELGAERSAAASTERACVACGAMFRVRRSDKSKTCKSSACVSFVISAAAKTRTKTLLRLQMAALKRADPSSKMNRFKAMLPAYRFQVESIVSLAAETLDISRNQVDAMVSVMLKRGEIVRVARGAYEVATV